MSDSIFNPEQFLDQVYEEANDTKTIPVPEGEYLALVDDVKARTWTSRDKMSSGISLDVVFDVQDENAKAATGREKVVVRYSFSLDLDAAGRIDFGRGKNTKLGKLREVLDMNTPGVPFSFLNMKGRMAKVFVTQRPSEDGQDIYNDIKSVSKVG